MSRTISRELNKTIQQKREQLLTIHEEVEDLIDYVDVLEAERAIKTKAPLRMLM
jgi:hypothetical protein